MLRSDDAYLELDDAPAPTPPDAPVDPTPELAETRGDEAFLEIADETGPRPSRGRVVTDDDLRMVTALADDARPLMAALWPAVSDLLASPPTAPELDARVALARTTLNQVTRRGAEWRARAEVAGGALTRRMDVLRHTPSGLHEAALEELRAWHRGALDAMARAEAGDGKRVYADGVRRLVDEARRRGLDESAVRDVARGGDIELLPGEVQPWTPCTVLPGDPRTMDGAAEALVRAQSQGVAALVDGSLVGWIRANRAPDALVAEALEAQSLAQEGRGAEGVWTLAWALGWEGVRVDSHTVTGPETLLAHLRAARLHPSRVADAAAVLARWFRRTGHPLAAAACEALAKGEAHAELGLRWALGEPLRLDDRAVTDPTLLAREVLARQSTRSAALDAWRAGTLRVWLDALPRTRRDALWLDDLAKPLAHALDEGAFWRGVYRRVPRAALRVYLADGRVVRFQTVGDLLATARVAAVWEPLVQCFKSGELRVWLAVAAPAVELDPAHTDDDVGLLALLAALGHTGLVIPWGRAAMPITTPADLVSAWRRSWQRVESQLAHGHVTAWLRRTQGASMGAPFDEALDAWGPTLGAGTAPPGVASLRLALLCGLDELPLDPHRPLVRGVVRGYRAVEPGARDPSAWEPLWREGATHRAHGTLLLWMARRNPAFATLAALALREADAAGDCFETLVAAGVPVRTDALATEHLVAEREAARLAAEREAAALAAEREAASLEAEREAARLAAEREEERRTAERERVRREVEREVARITAERDDLRAAMEREVARLEAERSLVQVEMERAVARLTAERDAARVEAERETVRLAMERDAAALDAQRAAARAAAERDEARLEAERARIERDIARMETEQTQRRSQRAKELADQEAAEREAARLHELDAQRAAAERDAERLRALEREAREAAAREAQRLDAMAREARDDAARRAAALAAMADEARRMAEAEAERLRALEDERRRETQRRAEEAAAEAARQAAEARRREEAEREAEELARRMLSEREVAREAAWAARRVAAEREIERLADAERRARALAEQLGQDTSSELPPPEEALDALAEIEGALDDEPEAPDVSLTAVDDEPEVLPERHEIDAVALLDARPVDDAPTLARVRNAVNQWARRQSGLASSEPSSGVELRAVIARPAFELHVTTRMESRALRFVPPPWRDADAVPVPPEATAPGASVDPWALRIPEVDAWATWRAELLLDTPPIRSFCRACEHGKVSCVECAGSGDRVCPTCNGRVRVRCSRCAGAGEVPGARGPVRCAGCDGRREQPCGACAFGRVPCARCQGRRTVSCVKCRGLGQLTERIAVVQRYEGVAAVASVRAGLPEALALAMEPREAEAQPVVHVEAAALDPYELAREIPHEALGAAAAQLLADEAQRAGDGQRATRQRLVVRRNPVFEARCRIDGDEYTVWVWGARDRVHADGSPRQRKLDALLDSARRALDEEALRAAADALLAAQELDGDHPNARAMQRELAAAVLRVAMRGEPFEARELAAMARRLRDPGCVAQLVEVERHVGARLASRSPWALFEEARAAFERNRDERCAERLTQLAALEPDHAGAERLAASLGERLAAQAAQRLDGGDLLGASSLVQRAQAVPYAACARAVGHTAVRVASEERAMRRRGWMPWAVAAVATLLALVALLAR